MPCKGVASKVDSALFLVFSDVSLRMVRYVPLSSASVASSLVGVQLVGTSSMEEGRR